MHALEFQSLTKWYGDTLGVEDLSFSVEAGEIFGFLGPNGAGKTTSIRCAMGLIRPTSGEVFLLGERCRTGRATCHDRIGYLPGDFRVWTAPPARRTLAMLAALGPEPESATARRTDLAERLGLKLDRAVWTLSKGNRQKVGILNAFQHRPDLLILDEPTSGLDPLVRQSVWQLIREAAADGAAVLLSSHDLTEVETVCSRVAVLREGRLVHLGPVTSLVEQGETRMNVWFQETGPIPVFPDSGIPHARLIEQQGRFLHLAFHGQPDALLKWVTRYPVERMEMPETSLEEAFAQYYGDTGRSKQTGHPEESGPQP
jgi:ABC-2 type transport system ATP-binding protein